MSERFVLVLGGTRSGKSRFGQARATALAAGRAVTYLATALAGDPELDRRVAGHRAARPPEWHTLEVGPDLAAAVRTRPPDEVLLLDGLTLWLSALVGDAEPDIDAILDGPVADAIAALTSHAAPVVVVSDEIGLGMVPLEPLSRAFRDLLGLAHQRVAAVSDEVHFMVAGLSLAVRDA